MFSLSLVQTETRAQIEGEKRWRLYKPHEQLPREYSRDLLQSELGAPTDDVVLEDGDMMCVMRY